MDNFNKLAVIAPSSIKDAKIDIERYADRVADIYYGPLDEKGDGPRILIVAGFMSRLAIGMTEGQQPYELISERLVTEYKIPPEEILLGVDKEAKLKKAFRKAKKNNKKFFREVADGTRELGLIADELQMPIGRQALKELNIQTNEFTVREPLFGGSSLSEIPAAEIIDLSSYRNTDEQLQAVGDE